MDTIEVVYKKKKTVMTHDELYMKMIPISNSISTRYVHLAWDDFDEIRNWAFYKTLKTYKIEKGAFVTLFTLILERECKRADDKAKKIIQGSYYIHEGKTLESLNFIDPKSSAYVDRVIEQDEVKKVLDKIPTKHKKVLIERYVLGIPMDELSKMYGVKARTIYAKLYNAKKSYKEAYSYLKKEEMGVCVNVV